MARLHGVTPFLAVGCGPPWSLWSLSHSCTRAQARARVVEVGVQRLQRLHRPHDTPRRSVARLAPWMWRAHGTASASAGRSTAWMWNPYLTPWLWNPHRTASVLGARSTASVFRARPTPLAWNARGKRCTSARRSSITRSEICRGAASFGCRINGSFPGRSAGDAHGNSRGSHQTEFSPVRVFRAGHFRGVSARCG